MLCCKKCIIHPICQIGCEKLLENINFIILRDFIKYKNLNKRLISIPNKNGVFNLKLEHGIKVKINEFLCKFTENGQNHREDGPAIEYANGTKYWYINGELHRDDGPAIEYANGTKKWYINGKCHRVDGPAIEYANGTKFWYINGGLHREDGPAVIYSNGTKYWYINGKFKKEE